MNLEIQARRRRTIDHSPFDLNLQIHDLKQENKRLAFKANDWKEAWWALRESFGTYLLWRHREKVREDVT